MVTKASGLDKLGESFVEEEAAPKKRKGGLKRASDAAKATRKLKIKVDERDPAVVAAQDAAGFEHKRTGAPTCSSCGELGHGFNDCPNVETLADKPAQDVTVYEGPTNGTLAARAFFSQDGWLTLPTDLPFPSYREVVERFGRLHENMLWHAGDLQVQGEALYGQEYSQVLELLAGKGYTESTLSVAKSVAEKFPRAERYATLSFNHHMAVMTLNKKERKHWLDRAAAENLSTRQLKEQIGAANGKPAKGGDAHRLDEHTSVEPRNKATAASEPAAEAAAQPKQLVTAAKGGVSVEMLSAVDAADKAFYDALDNAREEIKENGAFDYDALRPAARALAASLLELIEALGQ